ncbi:MAG: HigA family addiction module antidote protein [Treponema sp.]|nr:HigA family addiction module antidote protein [Treponema sp.]
MNSKDLKPFYNVGPGDYIVDFLDSFGWTQSDLAEVTGISTKTINLLINNKQGITPDTAITLEKVFGTPADFWIEVDAQYQIRKKEEQNSEKNELTAKKAMLRKYMPVAEMKKKGWFLYDIDTLEGIELECLRVFNRKDIPEEEYKQDYKFCARQTNFDYEYTRWYSKTWFEYAKLNASSFELPKYNKQKLLMIAKNLFSYTLRPNGVTDLINDLQSCGVGFFVLSHLQKTYLDGAAFISNNNPFVVYTCRYDRIDNFWFVIAHEIAHILNHYDFLNEPILDNLDEKAESEREIQADTFAGMYLNQEQVIAAGKQYGKYLNASRLQLISEQTKVSIPVALGMLQHFGILDWRQFVKYKEHAKNQIPAELIKG